MVAGSHERANGDGMLTHVLVRYSEIGTKSARVQGQMLEQLRSRVEERLRYDGIDGSVVRSRGRIVIKCAIPEIAAESIAELPGVRSTSPAVRIPPNYEAIEQAAAGFGVGRTFGIRANVVDDHPFTSRDLEHRVGAHVEEQTPASVDLDDPATWIEIDVRSDAAYVFADRYDGPGGFPVGSQAPLAALISGGIDSPVAAYEVMTRGADIVPVYFYNKPIAAGDHLVRFEAALSKLVRFHPARTWSYYRIDMEDVNTALLDVDRGRMLAHRVVMFRTAAHIVEDEGLAGLVTGESIGQKSSQTTANLALTAGSVRVPVFRPLLTWPKEKIVEKAKRTGTFEDAVVDSACRSLAPPSPATSFSPSEFDELADRLGLDHLVETALDATEQVDLAAVPEP